MTNQDFDHENTDEFGHDFAADFETLGTRATDLLSAYQELNARFISLEGSHQVAVEEAQRLATELDLTHEENRKVVSKLKRERDDAQRDLAMMKADVTAVAGTLVNSINAMRRRAAERAKARQPLQGAPQRPQGQVLRDLDDPSHLKVFQHA